MIERLLGIAIPTREEMQEIEVSSRLYVENGARYMTATLMCQSDTDMPKTTPVTFILAGHKLVTVRYDEPRPFTIVTLKLARACPDDRLRRDRPDGPARCRDRPRRRHSREESRPKWTWCRIRFSNRRRAVPTARAPTTTSCAPSAARATSPPRCARAWSPSAALVLFVANEADGMKWPKEMRAQLKVMQRDVQSLSDHADLSVEQDHLPARRHARHGLDRAEQHHQDLLGGLGRAHAADPDRLDLRHELQAHAGARLDLRLSDRAGS